MPIVRKSMQIPELGLKPPIEGAMRLSEDMQQTLALLCGYAVNKRVLLATTDFGVLHTTGPRFADVKHITGSGANDHPDMPDIACSEIMVMGHPDNTGLVWVRPGDAATVNNAVPIAANNAMVFSTHNVRNLSVLVVVDGETAILAIAR